jgi:hypothetical protein
LFSVSIERKKYGRQFDLLSGKVSPSGSKNFGDSYTGLLDPLINQNNMVFKKEFYKHKNKLIKLNINTRFRFTMETFQ